MQSKIKIINNLSGSVNIALSKDIILNKSYYINKNIINKDYVEDKIIDITEEIISDIIDYAKLKGVELNIEIIHSEDSFVLIKG